MAKKLGDWSPYKIYWDIFFHLGRAYRTKINFGPAYEKNLDKHLEWLKERDTC